MDLKLKTEIIGVHVWMTLDDVVKFIQSPRDLQEQLRIILNAGGIDPRTGRKIQKLVTGAAIGARPGTNAAASGSPPEPMVACPDCGKLVKPRGLKIHQTRFCPGRFPDNVGVSAAGTGAGVSDWGPTASVEDTQEGADATGEG
jgi:hypothetical protein